jgi:hypothetical protein
MNEVNQIRFLKESLRLAQEQTEHASKLLLDIIGDKCRSCKKQGVCWGNYRFTLLTEVALKGGEEWECANYDPLSCASVMGRLGSGGSFR